MKVLEQLFYKLIKIPNIFYEFPIELNAPIVVALIGAIALIISAIIQKSKDKTVASRRKALKNIIKHKLSETGREPVFFEPVTSRGEYNKYRKYVFIKAVPMNNRQKDNGLIQTNCSAIIKGEAGIGKSTQIDNIFLIRNTLYKRFFQEKILSSFCIKLTLKELLEDSKLRELLQNIKCRKLTLLIDGFDETAEGYNEVKHQIQKFIEFYRGLSEAKKTIILLFGRTEFVEKYAPMYTDIRGLFCNIYELKKWNEQDITNYESRLLNLFAKNTDSDNRKAIEKFLNSKVIKHCIDYNPLRCKMMVYLCIHQNNTYPTSQEPVEFKEPYNLYNAFMRLLLSREYTRASGIAATEQIIDEVLSLYAEYAFDIYKGNKISSERNEAIQKSLLHNILLTSSPETKTYKYIHKTFEEFLVSYYVHSLLNQALNRHESTLKKLIDVLSLSYRNSYADFITSGLKGLSEHNIRCIYELLVEVYLYTFQAPPEEYKNFKVNNNIKKHINMLGDEALLSLKYEIIFVFGRIKYDFAKDFLSTVYRKDNLIIYRKRQYDNYKQIILMRCCAISASLIGEEHTEIDYIQKMIPDNKEYNANYDLVNRSHTLIYYNDVPYSSIYDFKDNDKNTAWANARKHRIERLKKSPENAQDKYARFRAFDLATIYCFMANRFDHKLSEEEKSILHNCVIEFNGISQQKSILLKELKEKILKKL